MKKAILILFLAALAILLLGTVLKTIFPTIVIPNLLAVLLVYLAFYEANAFGAAMAFCIGAELDFCSGLLLGPWAGAYVVAFIIVVLCSRRVFIESSIVIFVVTLISSLITVCYHHFIISLVNEEISYDWSVFKVAFLEALLGAIFAPLILPLFRRKKNHKKHSSTLSGY